MRRRWMFDVVVLVARVLVGVACGVEVGVLVVGDVDGVLVCVLWVSIRTEMWFMVVGYAWF